MFFILYANVCVSLVSMQSCVRYGRTEAKAETLKMETEVKCGHEYIPYCVVAAVVVVVFLVNFYLRDQRTRRISVIHN